jgi:hypothetical protein
MIDSIIDTCYACLLDTMVVAEELQVGEEEEIGIVQEILSYYGIGAWKRLLGRRRLILHANLTCCKGKRFMPYVGVLFLDCVIYGRNVGNKLIVIPRLNSVASKIGKKH